MNLEKMKSLSETKLRYSFPKNVKFHFLGLFCDFSYNFIIKFMYEDDVGLTWFFFMVLFIILSFQIKKIKFQKFWPHGFLRPWSINKIFRFCIWHGLWHLINFEQIVPDAWFSHKQFHENNQFYIHLIVVKP